MAFFNKDLLGILDLDWNCIHPKVGALGGHALGCQVLVPQAHGSQASMFGIVQQRPTSWVFFQILTPITTTTVVQTIDEIHSPWSAKLPPID